MGKIKVVQLGTEEEERLKKKRAEKREQKKLRKQAKKKKKEDLKIEREAKKKAAKEAFEKKEEEKEEKKEVKKEEKKEIEKEEKKEVKEEKKEVKKEEKKAKVKVRTKRYQKAAKSIDKNKLYSLSEAIELVKKTSTVNFDASIEAHINTTEKGLKTSLTFPYPTGKKKKVVICNDKVLGEIEKGKIDFDVLIAEPSFMAKLAKFAKILGPKGLMPNPKQGTISEDPEKTRKEIEKGKTLIKTEPKALIIHTTIGKVSQAKKEILENLKELIKVVKPAKIKKLVLSSSMGPGVKVKVKKN